MRYQLPISGGHSLVFGADAQEAKTTANQNAYYDFEPSKWRSRQHQYGLFAEGQIRATDSTYVTAGVRRQYASDDLDVISGTGTASDRSNHLTAWQLGVRQDLAAGFGVYGKIGRSFRLPNADELLSVQSPLAAQTSTDKEIGITWQDARSSARLSYFRSDLTNEIQYNPLADGIWSPGTGANTNLDPTRRQGVELEGHTALTSSLALDANVTWMEAQFRSGTYAGVDLSGKTVPLAPKWLANAGVTWRPTDAFLWNVTAQYVGKSRMDNDQANQFGKQLDAYVLFNTKLAYKFTRNIEGAIGVNNIFDREYATYGIRGGNASFEMLGPVANYSLYPARAATSTRRSRCATEAGSRQPPRPWHDSKARPHRRRPGADPGAGRRARPGAGRRADPGHRRPRPRSGVVRAGAARRHAGPARHRAGLRGGRGRLHRRHHPRQRLSASRPRAAGDRRRHPTRSRTGGGRPPDLLIAWQTAAAEPLARVMDKLGVPVFYSDPQRLDAIPGAVERMGVLFGTEARARPAADALRARLDALKARYAGRRPVRVFVQAGLEPIYTLNDASIVSDALRACGGVNVFGQAPVVARRSRWKACWRPGPRPCWPASPGRRTPRAISPPGRRWACPPPARATSTASTPTRCTARPAPAGRRRNPVRRPGPAAPLSGPRRDRQIVERRRAAGGRFVLYHSATICQSPRAPHRARPLFEAPP